MVDWFTISVALAIIAVLVSIFGFMAWKINMPDPLDSTGRNDDTNQLVDSINHRKKKDKYSNDQTKKRRKDQKRLKRENKDQRQLKVQFEEPVIQLGADIDNEHEDSEQESSTPSSEVPKPIEIASKVRKRNKNKVPPTIPIEGILINKDEKSPVTTEAEPIPHPLLETIIPKDEVELAKEQHSKTKMKSSQTSNKKPIHTTSAPVKNLAASAINIHQEIPEQPFTTVASHKHKSGTPPSQQPTKSIDTPSSLNTSGTSLSSSSSSIQQKAPVQIQHEQLAQRQQKEASTQLNGLDTNPLSIKQSTIATVSNQPMKLADLIKTLPTSKTIVTELMSAFDAISLSTDELDIIMHKIANKQSVLNKDWTKLQHGQKVDPEAHIGQILDASARAYEENMKNNAMKRIQELTDELNNNKRQISDLLNEKNEKDNDIQVLRAQLNTYQPQQQIQAEFKRLTDENKQLKQQLAQQQYTSLSIINSNADTTNAQLRVLIEQTKKLSVDNANLEKQLQAKDLLIKEEQKAKDDLTHTHKQFLQKTHENQLQFKHKEDKLLKELNESRTLHMNQINEHKRHIEQLELDNEKLRHEHKAQIESLLNNDEKKKMEQEINQLQQQLIEQKEQYQQKYNEMQIQYQTQENELRQEVKNNLEQRQHDQIHNDELADKGAQIDKLRTELEEVKAKNDAINTEFDQRLRQEQNKQKQFLIELLEQDVRNQLDSENQDFNQWLLSYQQVFISSIESNKRILKDEVDQLKHENDQLHRDRENQLKEIEQTTKAKEESLLNDIKNKDTTLESIRNENEQLNNEIQRLRGEFDHLKLTHDASMNEIRSLKIQLEQQQLISGNSSDELSEFVKHQSPHSNEFDTRVDQLNELIRSSKEALENQDSFVQQLDKHLNEIHHGGTGEIPTTNVDESTVSSSSDQQQQSES